MMGEDWLTELQRLRDEDKSRVQTSQENREPDAPGWANWAGELLKQCDAHNLLRQVQKMLLGGKGMIDIFDHTRQYDRVMALVWQGPISQARLPRVDDPEAYHYILVGVKGQKVYVNGRLLKEPSPENLKTALIWAAKNPGQQPGK